MKQKILLVDDEPNVLSAYGRILRAHYDVVTADSGEAGLAALAQQKMNQEADQQGFAVIVSDFRMPRMDGVRFLAQAREQAVETVRIMLTGEADLGDTIKAVNEGNIFRFLTKPCPQDSLLKAIGDGCEQYRLIQVEKIARKKEVMIAGQIQQSLLIGRPPVKLRGMKIASESVPSRGVDGDFIDFFDHSESCVDVILGDVMGKGIPAALIGAGTKSRFARVLARLFATAAATGSSIGLPSPESIVQGVHQKLGSDIAALNSFVTLVYARFDTVARRMTFVDAGHTPTLQFVAATGVCNELKGIHPPLGFPDLGPYTQIEMPFATGDLFLLYSDGLMEGRNGAREFFGKERLVDALRELRDAAPETIKAELIRRVRVFTGIETPSDDLSVVVVRIED